MSNTLLLKRSGTAAAVPAGANLSLGELAINYADGNLFYKDAGGTVKLIASNQLLSVIGNVTGGNINTAGLVSATGNVIGGNLVTIGLVTASGNITGGNILTAGYVSATGNVTGNYILGNGALLTGVVTSVANINNGNSNVSIPVANGNIIVSVTGTSNVAVFASTGEYVTGLISASGNITGGNLLTGGLISATGAITGANITGANILTAGLISAGGNVTGANILTGGLISATGNITGGNVNTPVLASSAGITIKTGSNGNINLQPNGTGNIVLANTFINSVAYPVQDQDAASKIYVDNLVATGLSYHTAVLAATTTTLATTTGGTITYTQPNGAGNGVGALLTTTGSFNLIDTANVQTVGTRILVKNEANAVYNGVYTWANATNIVRSLDTDQYGPDSSSQLSLNDYFFVTGGTVNEGSAWVVDAPTGTITFGTSNISFAQFSQSQVYEANTSAGLSLVGTTFSAKVDNSTTAFDGTGNIIVKASANLVTPNIGAATGTSLSVTGNITGGNIIGTVVATSFSTAGNITGGNLLTSGLISATGNITGGNLNTTGALTSATYSASGNITGGNLLTAGNVSATGNVTGGNLIGTIATASQTNITGLGNITTGTWSANTIGLAYGGTGKTTAPAAMAALMGYTSTATASGTTTLTNTSSYYQQFTGTSTQTVVLPVTSTLQTGWTFHIVNNSTGNLSVQSSGLNAVITVIPGTTAMVTCIGTALTTAADWESGITDFSTYTGTGDNVFSISPVLTTPNIGAATGTSVSVSGNVTGGNLLTGGLISVGGNVTGANLLTGGLISSTGNITSAANIAGGNLLATTAMYVGGVSVLTVNSTVDGGTY